MSGADVEDSAGELADARAGGAAPAGDGASEGEAARVERAAAALERAWAVEPAELDRVLDELRAEAAPAAVLPEGYEDLGEIGRGGTGVVHRARQRALNRLVAVKVLKGGDFLFGSALARFSREARALAQLRHPHIVSIHEVGEERGRLWYAMDLVEGRSLAERLKEGPLAPRAAARLLADVADAVSYVHEHGLVHRDLKPANIVLDANGSPFVTDFGLALEIGGDDGLTLTGQIVGTPAYMSPEQARGDLAAVGPATDVYALGAVLYECLTGRRPFQGLSPAEQVYAAIHREPLAPRSLDAEIPVAVERICLQALRKAPAERYATAAAMRDDLRRFVAGERVEARPVGRTRRLREAVRRRAGVVGWAVAAGLAVVLAFGLHRSSKDAAQAFVEAGDGLLARGNGEGAARMFERALEAGVGGLADRLTRAYVLEARSLWGSGKAEEAARLMQREQVEGRARAEAEWRAADPYTRGDGRWKNEGDVRWELATALELSGRTPEADKTFDEALLDLRLWGGLERRDVGTRLADTLRKATPAAARPAVVAQVKAVIRDHFTDPLSAVLPHAADVPELLATALELVGTVPDPALGRPNTSTALLLGRRAARRASAGAALPVFARIADDTARSSWARLAAAALLAEGEDLPVDVRVWSSVGTPLPDLNPFGVTEAWRSLQGMGAEKAHWARARLAVRSWRAIPERGGSAEPRTLGGVRLSKWLADWLESRTGMPAPRDADAAERWIGAHESEPAWQPLALALGLPGRETPPDRAALLRDWSRRTPLDRLRTFALLRLLAPVGVRSPAPSEEGSATWAWAEWAEVFRPSTRPLSLAVARVVFDPVRGWEYDPAAAGTVELRQDTTSVLRREGPAPPDFAVTAAISPPGFGAAQPLRARFGFEVQVTPTVTARGDAFRVDGAKEWSEGPGWSHSGSSGGFVVSTDFVFSPECWSLGWGSPEPGRNTLHLYAASTGGDPVGTPQSLDQWRTRIAADLARLADRAEEMGRDSALPDSGAQFLSDYYREILGICHIASRLGVPEARDALRRLEAVLDRTSGTHWENAFCLIARLLTKDAELLADPGLKDRIARVVDRVGMDALEARTWGRVLCVERDERLRAVATSRLEGLKVPADVAGDLLEAESAGGPAIPASLRRKMEEGEGDDHSVLGQLRKNWPYSAAVALIWLGALAATLRWAWRGRPRWKRVVPAAWMVVVGVLMDALDLFVHGVDVLPDALGWVLAALGAHTLGNAVTGGPARWPGRLFAITALLTLLGWFVAPPSLLEPMRTTTIALGIALLPTLVEALRGSAEGIRVRGIHVPVPYVLLYVLPMGLIVFLLWRLQFTGKTHRFGSDTGPLLLLAIAVAVLWALLSLRTAAGVRAAWLRLRAGPPEAWPA